MNFPEPTATLPDDIPGMSVTQLTRELAQHNLPTDGPKHTLVTRLQEAAGMTSNQAYHAYSKRATEAAAGIDKAMGLYRIAPAGGWVRAAARERLANHRHEQSEAQRLLKELQRRLFFAPKLPSCVLLSILGQLGKKAGRRAACVQREWRGSVAKAKAMGMYDIKVTSVAAGSTFTVVCTSSGAVFTFGGKGGNRVVRAGGRAPFLGHGDAQHVPRLVETLDLQPVRRLVETLEGKKVNGTSAGHLHTAAWTDAGELFTFGNGGNGRLGHGGQTNEYVPRLVEMLAGKKVIGASAANDHTTAWTDAGELFTFGYGFFGRLGHGGGAYEFVPRLVEALGGKKVIGASAGEGHTAAWTDAGELFTFGAGYYGQLGHGGEANEFVPRLVEALGGKKVIGASAGEGHTAAWTDAGELFTFGNGGDGLGHGGQANEFVPRLVEALGGKKVIGASAGKRHTAAWTDAGELFTFGAGYHGRLGHGGEATELVPRPVVALEL